VTQLTGLGRLVRLILRRDRIRLWSWLLGLGVVIVASAASLPPVYPDQASIDAYAATVGDNPALMAFAGPGYGLRDDPTIGAILVNEVQLWGAIGFALMSIFLVNHHTRAEEDVERADLIRSTVVGRHAPTAAAVVVVGAANLALGLVCAAGFVATGYETTGSIVLAASLVAVGLVFLGVTAVTAQAASSGRAALGMAASVLAAAFALRALGDVSGNWMRWASPIGWAQASRAFAGERWLPLVLCVVAAAVGVVSAFWLSTRRDLGSGLVPTKPGPGRASPRLTDPLGLAVRLHRGSLIGWAIGLFVAGALYGSIGDDVEQMLEDNPVYQDILVQTGGADLTDSFFASSLLMLSLVVSGFAIATVSRLRSEESAGRAEVVLASGVSRSRWAASHLLVAFAGAAAGMVLSGFGLGLSYAAVSGDSRQIGRLVFASLAPLPAVAALIGVAMLLYGRASAAVVASWAVLAVVSVIALLAEVLRLPSWLRQISPFAHVSQVPAEAISWPPAIGMVAVAGALVAAGMAALDHRDMG